MNVSDIYALPTKAQLVDFYLSQLAANNCPVTDWYVGSKQRTMIEQTETTCAIEMVDTLLEIAKQNWIDQSEGDWLSDLAHCAFALDRVPGTLAVQSVTLAVASGFAAVTILAGDLLVGADSKIYTADSGGTISGGGTLTIQATAQQIGPLRGLISRPFEPKAGLSVAAASVATVGGVKRYGALDETDASLRARCLARWPSLTDIPKIPRVVKWSLASSAEVTRVKIAPGPAPTTFPNEVLITLASAAGAMSSPGLTTAIAYLMAPRRPIGQRFTIRSATTAAIKATGSVWCPRGSIPAVQTAAQTAWATYLATVNIGSKISLERLETILKDAGAYDWVNINLGNAGGGGVFPYDYVLASTEVPILPSVNPTLALQLFWFEV